MAVPKTIFTTKEAADISGLEMRRVIYEVDRRMIIPEHAEAAGHGSKRLLGVRNLIELAITELLYNVGVFEAGMIRRLMDTLRKCPEFMRMYAHPHEALTGLASLAGGENRKGTVTWIMEMRELWAYLPPGPQFKPGMKCVEEATGGFMAHYACIVPGLSPSELSVARDIKLHLPEPTGVLMIHALDLGFIERGVFAEIGL